MDKQEAIDQCRLEIARLNNPAWQMAVIHGMAQATAKDREDTNKALNTLYRDGQLSVLAMVRKERDLLETLIKEAKSNKLGRGSTREFNCRYMEIQNMLSLIDV